eukprot:COSAG01_NODE_411_length_17360_cov_11.401852_15_plen_91_part_00
MWYHSNGYCSRCDDQSGFLITLVLFLLTVVLGPILFQVAALTRHMGALSGPLMSIVNFFQTADLFAMAGISPHLQLKHSPAAPPGARHPP